MVASETVRRRARSADYYSDGGHNGSPRPFRVEEGQAADFDDDDGFDGGDGELMDEPILESPEEDDEEEQDEGYLGNGAASNFYSSDEDFPSGVHRFRDHGRDYGLPMWQSTGPTWSRTSSSSSKSDDSLPRRHATAYVSRSYSNSPVEQQSPSSASFLFQGGFFYLAFCLCALTAMYTSRATLATTLQQVALLDTNRATMNAQLQSTERSLMRIKRQVLAMDAMAAIRQEGQGRATDAAAAAAAAPSFEGQKASVAERRRRQETTRALKELHGLQNRIKGETTLVDRLKQEVRDTAKRDVLAKYGPGPHRVEMELAFADRKMGGATRFVMELADVDTMPHSVYTFLEMVSRGLLDGCSFILNALHVVKAAPLPYDGSSAAQKAQAFAEAGLESVAFKEYSGEYPHKQYTVGFAADGSPSFYINTQDNSDVHVGDPCFGRIVSGIDAVKRLEAQPTRNGIWFEKRIGIKVARILKA